MIVGCMYQRDWLELNAIVRSSFIRVLTKVYYVLRTPVDSTNFLLSFKGLLRSFLHKIRHLKLNMLDMY